MSLSPFCFSVPTAAGWFLFLCVTFRGKQKKQGNFAQFLENADSVTGMAGEEAGGSFINVFALPELKVNIVCVDIMFCSLVWMASLYPVAAAAAAVLDCF